MLYVLVTNQTWRDTNVPSCAPRLIDTDPKKVLAAAREILNSPKDSEEWNWVQHIFVYALEPGRLYSIWNASSLPHVNKEDVHTVAYSAWWSSETTHEKIYGEFAKACGEPATLEAEE